MKTFKGMPGNWKLASKNYDKGFYYINQKDITSNSDRDVKVVSLEYGEHPDKAFLDRAEANAKLIAAAPELLEALQYCLTTLQNIDDTIETISDHQTYFNSTRNSMELAEKALNKAL